MITFPLGKLFQASWSNVDSLVMEYVVKPPSNEYHNRSGLSSITLMLKIGGILPNF